MKNILVTGGAGFIGSCFVRMLLDEFPELTVVNLDKLTYAGNLDNLNGGYLQRHRFIKGDIGDNALINGLLKEFEVEAIVNFAAESHVDRSIDGPGIFVEVNVQGTLNLLEAARECGIKRFLQVSTDEVYGSLGPDDDKFREDTRLCPNSPYSASKAAADHLVHSFGHTYGMDVLITRCSNNYGPCQFPEKLIPLMISNAWQDKRLPVYGDGGQIRDWLHVYDHCSAVWEVLRRGKSGEVYNIGGNNEYKNIDVVRLILKRLNKPESLIRYVDDRQGHDRRYAIDARKIERELGWQPSVTFERGLPQTIDWYLNHQEWLGNLRRLPQI
ncbi:MAG: dTDP-glucose 4,6-dehydratase [bacterium]